MDSHEDMEKHYVLINSEQMLLSIEAQLCLECAKHFDHVVVSCNAQCACEMLSYLYTPVNTCINAQQHLFWIYERSKIEFVFYYVLIKPS